MIKIKKFYVPVFLLLCIFFLTLGFLNFYNSIKSYKDIDNIEFKGIAVLTGGKGRIAKGIRLFNQNQERYLIISGVDKKADIKSIIPRDITENQRVFLDRDSESTVENAKAIVLWAQNNNIKNINIITSDYHMLRSMLTLRKQTSNINFYESPVMSSIYLEKNFFKKPQALIFLLEEYLKYLLSFFII